MKITRNALFSSPPFLLLSPVMFQRQPEERSLQSMLSSEKIIIKHEPFHPQRVSKEPFSSRHILLFGILALCLFGGRRRERVIRRKARRLIQSRRFIYYHSAGRFRDRRGWGERGKGGFLWPVTHIFFSSSSHCPPQFRLFRVFSSLTPPCSFSSKKKGGGKNCGIERLETGGSG